MNDKPIKENSKQTLLKSVLEEKIKKITNKEATKIRMEKIIQSQFEKKMARIKKLKSRNNRVVRKRLKLNTALDVNHKIIDTSSESEEITDDDNCNIAEIKPNDLLNSEGNKFINFNVKNKPKENEIYETEFQQEKEEIIEKEIEKIETTILPGWNQWGSSNIKVKETKYNILEKTQKGIEESKRKDFKKTHIIHNEKFRNDECQNIKGERTNRFHNKLPLKMKADEYKLILENSVSKESNLISDFEKIIEPKKRKEKKSEAFRYFNNKNDKK